MSVRNQPRRVDDRRHLNRLRSGGRWRPHAPLHASATHGQDSFAIATGEVDLNLEGIYFLDMITGELTGYVINPNNGKFTTLYKHNVLKDMVELTKPRFLMVTWASAFCGKVRPPCVPAPR